MLAQYCDWPLGLTAAHGAMNLFRTYTFVVPNNSPYHVAASQETLCDFSLSIYVTRRLSAVFGDLHVKVKFTRRSAATNVFVVHKFVVLRSVEFSLFLTLYQLFALMVIVFS